MAIKPKKEIDTTIFKIPYTEVKKRLIELINEKAFIDVDNIRPTGQISDYYIDIKEVTLGSEGAMVSSLGIINHLRPEVNLIGGLQSRAGSIASGATQLLYLQNRKVNNFLLRKQTRKHGRSKWIEGPIEFGAKACIVQDVVTDASSAIDCIRALQEEFPDVEVVQVISIFDRSEGGKERLENLGIDYTALCTIEEVLDAHS